MNTRHEILAQKNLGTLTLSSDRCYVSRGFWRDPYTNNDFADPADVEIDHLIPLHWAWHHGASEWSSKKRFDFFNDPIGVIRGPNIGQPIKE